MMCNVVRRRNAADETGSYIYFVYAEVWLDLYHFLILFLLCCGGYCYFVYVTTGLARFPTDLESRRLRKCIIPVSTNVFVMDATVYNLQYVSIYPFCF